ncbi:M48 family metallopeptidase [Corallococcus carmarthensis]|uniref:M48 family metallopeptidase n=1 Tax=Corallococcus carmarthensis TaxID=2316728 RepID=UPI00148D2C7C|nr:M48 family metallopeptidase [Corallococcus carmarthensis]NOK15580.1 M48 family metalloprotease [Corallococcus carmarthensis]
MASSRKSPGFVSSYVLPALLLFALPLFGFWFSGHASDRFDAQVLEVVEKQIGRDTEMTAADRQEALSFYRAVPASAACLSDREELTGYRDNLGEACSDVKQFGWAHTAAWILLALGLASTVVALLCVLAAFISRPFQYGGFLVGWHVLRITSALQVLGQGALLVWLSYWVTALWLERYSPKLILLMAIAAGLAVIVVVMAIFRRPPTDFDVEAEEVPEARAPELWACVRRLCERLQTSPPDHILAGIDTNFFVTEHEVRVGGRMLSGRTLFVSVSLLRLLERSEAEAVLAHEMGHLLGGDTGHSKRLAPMLSHFGHYLQALYEGGLTRPVFYFMQAYRGLFELSLGRSRRASELAADRLAAGVTSGQDIARSLVKVGAYAGFRDRVEAKLFAQDEQHQSVAIARRVAHGFSEYAQSEAVHDDLQRAVTPHPFDSHPPLAARMQNVGVQLKPADMAQVLLEPVTSSWVEAFVDAEAIEARLWGVYEERFAQAHDLALACRYEPSTDAERQHVEKHFPPLTFEGKEAGFEVRMDYAQVSCTDWEQPVPFERVASAATADRMFKKYLDLKVTGESRFKNGRSLCLSKLKDPDAALAAFERFLGRHRFMKAHRSDSQAA